MRLHRNANSLRDTSKAAPWLYTIARRTIADYFRNKKNLPDHLQTNLGNGPPNAVPPTEWVAPEPGSSVVFDGYDGNHTVHEEVLTWLRPLAEELPKPYRDALLLADFRNMPQKQIAEQLGISLSATKSRIQRARVKLGEALQQCCLLELDSDGTVIDFKRRLDD